MNLGERSVKILKIFIAQIAKSSWLYHTDIGGHIIPHSGHLDLQEQQGRGS